MSEGENQRSDDGCHRGIFAIDGPLPGYQFPTTVSYDPLGGALWTAADGIYRSIFVEGDESVVCFDTFWSPAAAQSYAQAVRRVFPSKPIETIVYSHEHLDHTGFALDLAPDAEIIAHADAAEVIAARQSDGQKPATQTWQGERKQLEIDGVEVELINPGPTHGNGNVAARFPEQGVLFMVDTVIPGVGYTFFPDWHLASYVDSMRRLEALEWDRFVPGHFWVTDRNGFAENLDYYEFMADAAQTALADGVDSDNYPEVERYATEHYGDQYGRLFRFHEYFGMNLMRVMVHFRTGGWGLEDNSGRPDGTAL